MATPLDTTLFGDIGGIFPFLLVLVVGYGILEYINLFKSRGLNMLIAFVLGVMVILSPIVRETLNMAAPWFVLLFLFIIFGLMAFMAMGATSDDIKGIISSGEYRYINFWIATLVLIIAIGSLTTVLARHGGVGEELDTGHNTDSQMTGDGSSSGTGGSDGSSAESSQGGTVEEDDQQDAFWDTLFHPKVLGFLLIMLIAVFTMQRLVKD